MLSKFSYKRMSGQIENLKERTNELFQKINTIKNL